MIVQLEYYKAIPECYPWFIEGTEGVVTLVKPVEPFVTRMDQQKFNFTAFKKGP